MTKPITAVLIDDELSALKGLEKKVNELFPQITIEKTFQQPEAAVSYLLKQQPDLVFLDIQMPRINGFDLLTKLKNIDFQLIFVTAYSEYAMKALKMAALAYVLKPVDEDELKEAVERAIWVIEKKQENKQDKKLIKLLSEVISDSKKIIIPTAKGLSFIPEEEIFHVEGYEGYTKFHLPNKTEIVSSYSIGKFEKMLGNSFFKCHKSHIINISKVRSFEKEGYLILENKQRVPISKSNKKVFLNLFN